MYPNKTSVFLFNFSFHPWWLSSEESVCNAGDPALIPGSGRSPVERNGYLLQYSCLENPMDRWAWWATDHEDAKSWTWLSDWLFLSFLFCISSSSPWNTFFRSSFHESLCGVNALVFICLQMSLFHPYFLDVVFFRLASQGDSHCSPAHWRSTVFGCQCYSCEIGYQSSCQSLSVICLLPS